MYSLELLNKLLEELKKTYERNRDNNEGRSDTNNNINFRMQILYLNPLEITKSIEINKKYFNIKIPESDTYFIEYRKHFINFDKLLSDLESEKKRFANKIDENTYEEIKEFVVENIKSIIENNEIIKENRKVFLYCPMTLYNLYCPLCNFKNVINLINNLREVEDIRELASAEYEPSVIFSALLILNTIKNNINTFYKYIGLIPEVN